MRPGVGRVAVAVAIVAGGCAIDPDDEPREVPEAERELAVAGQGSEAAGGERIYLVGPGDARLLRSVPREASTRDELIRTLLRGPNDDEVAAQYSSVIPPTTELLGTTTQGQLLTIDLSEELTELNTAALVQAIAQIVYTASEIDGIRTVRVAIEGETREWATLDGSPQTDLQTFDFPGVVQTAQPAYPALPSG